MKLVDKKITVGDLKEMAEEMFGDLVKAVVDIEKGIMVVGGELQADEEAELLQTRSKQANLWGINLYPAFYGQTDFIEFDSMINVRPSQANPSRSVLDEAVREKIREIVESLVGV